MFKVDSKINPKNISIYSVRGKQPVGVVGINYKINQFNWLIVVRNGLVNNGVMSLYDVKNDTNYFAKNYDEFEKIFLKDNNGIDMSKISSFSFNPSGDRNNDYSYSPEIVRANRTADDIFSLSKYINIDDVQQLQGVISEFDDHYNKSLKSEFIKDREERFSKTNSMPEQVDNFSIDPTMFEKE